MIEEKNLEKIKKEVQFFFQKASFDVEVEIGESQGMTIPVDLKMEEPRVLIGERGQTLVEVQHLLKAIIRRKIIKEPFYLNLDINGYKKQKIEYLKELAKTTADNVLLTKEEKIIGPMLAYERRIIHLELAERKGIITESVGIEPERKVAIKSL